MIQITKEVLDNQSASGTTSESEPLVLSQFQTRVKAEPAENNIPQESQDNNSNDIIGKAKEVECLPLLPMATRVTLKVDREEVTRSSAIDREPVSLDTTLSAVSHSNSSQLSTGMMVGVAGDDTTRPLTATSTQSPSESSSDSQKESRQHRIFHLVAIIYDHHPAVLNFMREIGSFYEPDMIPPDLLDLDDG